MTLMENTSIRYRWVRRCGYGNSANYPLSSSLCLGAAGQDLSLGRRGIYFAARSDGPDDWLAPDIMDVGRALPAILVWLGPIYTLRQRLRTLFRRFVPALLELCRKRIRTLVDLRPISQRAIPKHVGDHKGRYHPDQEERRYLGRP